MIRLFLMLIWTSTFLLAIDAQTICAVGESGEAVGGFCNEADGDNKCKIHCQKYGAELIKAACSAPRGGNQKRECVCSLKCANGGCWGDPHCWSFDGRKFGYQSLKKYYVFKPCKEFPTLPEWEIIQTNHPWGPGPMAVLDTLDVLFPDFGQMIEVVVPKAPGQAHTLTVNKQAQPIPYRFSQFHGHREDFIDITFTDPQKYHLVITTNFGLRITITSNPTGAAGPTSIYSDVSVDIPRHPELKGNTCGILGRWNDDPKDDNIDANGKPQPLDDQFSAAFGDSWLVSGGELPSECEIEIARAAHDEHHKQIKKEHKDRLRKMCKDNLEHGEMHGCLKHLGRPTHTIDDCVLDLSHIENENDQKEFLKAMVAKFIHACPDHNINFKHPQPTDKSDSCKATVEQLGLSFNYAGPAPGKHCVSVNEPSDPHTWSDNFVCFNKDYGVRWSHAGTIGGMDCTQVLEPADTHTWVDNFLCVPKGNSWRFFWSHTGKPGGKSCVLMNEPSDPHTWTDNYLCVEGEVTDCNAPAPPAPQPKPAPPPPPRPAPHPKPASQPRLASPPPPAKTEVSVERLGLSFNYAGHAPGKHCVLVNEPSDPHTWGDNLVCFNRDYGVRWSHAGAIGGMDCTQILEPSDPHTWADNFLCVPRGNSWRFFWSHAGRPGGKSCVLMNEPSDPHTWGDNYLCVEGVL